MSQPSTRTNWHEAIFCAVQIDLKNYSHLLEYHNEYTLSANKNRIDILVIKKQTDFQIPKHIASIFRTYNIFENKGLSDTLTKKAYYKTNGHACYYIDSLPKEIDIDRRDVTLTFISFKYPRKLFRHLSKECNLTIEKPFPGVYYIVKDMYPAQVLVLHELSPEDSMYLYCLQKNIDDPKMIDTLLNNYKANKNNKLYTDYMNQFLYSRTKGDPLMVCEGIFKLYGTSSKEIAENAAEQARKQTREQYDNYYLPQIEKLTETVNTLMDSVNTLTSELNHTKQLLAEHNINY